MRKIGIRRLTKETFARYGSFASILEPKGDRLGEPPVEFYRDMVQQSLGRATQVSYSACVVEARNSALSGRRLSDACGARLRQGRCAV